MNEKNVLAGINGSGGVELLESLYGPGSSSEARLCYASLLEGILPGKGFPVEFSPRNGELRLFSAPGRTELGGNHTDHNRGRVLAAAVHMDIAAVAAKRDDGRVFLRSAGFSDTLVNLEDEAGRPDLSPKPEEQGTTGALVRGIAAGFAARGVDVCGFVANVSSKVPQGSGLSSSAALEVLVAKIFDGLYGGDRLSPLELARIGQEAENVFFGKPCGLMDQTACAFGGAVAIDFANPSLPLVNGIGFDPLAAGYALCVVDTRGSHADLTPDYASIPQEMNAVAGFFGKSFLREIDLSMVLSHAAKIRESVGDRALLRSIHFFNENRRVAEMAVLLGELETVGDHASKSGVMGRFLDLVNESGDSSWELLQNIYSSGSPGEQGLSLAIAVSREFFRGNGMKAACRVHGGGFAGTVQAYIPVEGLDGYRARMEALFGDRSLAVLRIRPVGTVELRFV